MQPINVVNWDVALSMWATGKAQTVAEYEEEIHSAYLTMKMPSVMRLLTSVKQEWKPAKFSRVNVYTRDKYKCQYCATRCSTEELTYDHVRPRTLGGKTEWANIVSCCVPCNMYKGGRTPEQAGMKLLKKPVQPVSLPQAVFAFTRKDMPETWRDFIYWTGELEE